jgi:hypothetical protein
MLREKEKMELVHLKSQIIAELLFLEKYLYASICTRTA